MKIKKFFKFLNNDYVLNVVSKVAILLLGLFTSVFSTRYLGVENKGAYAYISQVANICVTIFNLGIYQSYSYNYKRFGKDTLKKYSDICFLQFLVYCIITTVLMFNIKDDKFVLAILLVPFNLLKLQYGNIVLIENIRLKIYINLLDKVLLTLCYAFLLFFVESNVVYFVFVTLFIDIFTVLYYLLKLKYLPKVWQVDFKFLKQIVKFGIVPMLSLFLVTINYSVDILFLEHMSSSTELGYYSLAVTIINYVWLLPDAFKEVLFSKSAKKFDKVSISLTIQISLGSIVCCLIGFVLFGKQLVKIFYGADFVLSYNVIIILILGAFSMSVFKLLGIVLISQGKRGMHFISLAISAVVNIIANLWSIPQWGMYGAAWSSVISYTVCSLILIPYFCKLFSYSPIELFVPSKSIAEKLISKVKK